MSRKARKSGEIRALKDLVESNTRCKKKFEEAQRLSEKIFQENVSLPFYTVHDASHCLKVEKCVNEIIWGGGNQLGKYDFIPTAEEAMYLRSAIWLHDIGMWYGIIDGDDNTEKLNDPKEVVAIRNYHEMRSSEYIQEKWKNGCTWTDDEKRYLANICIYHRRANPISNFQPYKIDGKYKNKKVRLAVLAALLRLADACHVDKSRAPSNIMALYISLGMQLEARSHWKKAELIREVKFNHHHLGNAITLFGHYPPKIDFDFAKFDLGEVGEIVRENVEEELRSVRAVLLNYTNTSFWNVDHEPNYLVALRHNERERYLALWPYLMDKPASSTEAVAVLIEVLRLAVKNGGRSDKLAQPTKDKIAEIMTKTKASRPVDFMVRNLCKEVEKRLTENVSASRNEFIEFLDSTKKRIKENRKKMMRNALGAIKEQDALLIYGYSANVATLLSNLDTARCLYMVDSSELSGVRGKFDECRRMIDLAKNRGFSEIKYLSVGMVPLALDELRGKKMPCKLLLGTHGVLKSRDFICKVGSYALAEIANHFNVEVIVFAEDMKILKNRIKDEEIAGREKLFSSENSREHCEMRGIRDLKAIGEKLPKRLVDMVVTEGGVIKIKDYKIGVKGKSGKKRSVKA